MTYIRTKGYLAGQCRDGLCMVYHGYEDITPMLPRRVSTAEENQIAYSPQFHSTLATSLELINMCITCQNELNQSHGQVHAHSYVRCSYTLLCSCTGAKLHGQ